LEIGPVVALRDIGKIAGRFHLGHAFGLRQPLLQFVAGGDVVHQEALQRAPLACLHVIGPGHHADACRVLGHGNEPEPAVFEPEDGDVAFGLALVASCMAKVGIDRGRAVARVAVLDAEFAGQKGVAARRIDQKAGAPVMLLTVVQARRDAHAAIGFIE